MGGVPVSLLDTAGMREASDVVEQLGVQRSRTAATAADIAIMVVDAQVGWTPEDQIIYDQLWGRASAANSPSGEGPAAKGPSAKSPVITSPSILVWNKVDLAPPVHLPTPTASRQQQGTLAEHQSQPTQCQNPNPLQSSHDPQLARLAELTDPKPLKAGVSVGPQLPQALPSTDPQFTPSLSQSLHDDHSTAQDHRDHQIPHHEPDGHDLASSQLSSATSADADSEAPVPLNVQQQQQLAQSMQPDANVSASNAAANVSDSSAEINSSSPTMPSMEAISRHQTLGIDPANPSGTVHAAAVPHAQSAPPATAAKALTKEADVRIHSTGALADAASSSSNSSAPTPNTKYGDDDTNSSSISNHLFSSGHSHSNSSNGMPNEDPDHHRSSNSSSSSSRGGAAHGAAVKDVAAAYNVPESCQQSFAACVETCAVPGQGLDALSAALLQLADAPSLAAGGVGWAVNARQAEALIRAQEALEAVTDSVNNSLPIDFWTIDLRSAVAALGEVSGDDVTEEVLDSVFSQFCIGK